MFTCKVIDTKSVYPIRHVVLRKGKPLSSCVFNGDELITTFHVGGFINDELVAVASILENNNATYKLNNAMQLRGMAVLEEFQGKGYGQQVLTFAETMALKRNKKILWMNARIVAVDFYKRLDYNKIGNVFEVLTIGKHYVMFKKLI